MIWEEYRLRFLRSGVRAYLIKKTVNFGQDGDDFVRNQISVIFELHIELYKIPRIIKNHLLKTKTKNHGRATG